jgi:hypothetical protein
VSGTKFEEELSGKVEAIYSASDVLAQRRIPRCRDESRHGTHETSACATPANNISAWPLEAYSPPLM